VVAHYLAPSYKPCRRPPISTPQILANMCICKILVLCLAFQPDQIFITGSGVDGRQGVITTTERISIRISNGDSLISFSKCACVHMYWLDLEMLIMPRSALAGHLSDSCTRGVTDSAISKNSKFSIL